MKLYYVGLGIFIIGLLVFHMNSTVGFIALLLGAPAPDPSTMEKGIMLILPGFYTPIGAVIMVCSGFLYSKKKKEVSK